MNARAASVAVGKTFVDVSGLVSDVVRHASNGLALVIDYSHLFILRLNRLVYSRRRRSGVVRFGDKVSNGCHSRSVRMLIG